jgi:molybdate transport system regulatory protein
MRLSTRNQLAGTVAEITAGDAMAVVKVALEGGDTITSSITREAAEDLGLETGQHVVVLIKSTDVALGVEDGPGS